MMKKLLFAAMTGLLSAGCVMSVSAAGLEDFYDYVNADGTYSYFFEQGVTITMSEAWYQNTFVEAEMGSAVFYHKDSYEKYKAEGIDNGGKLFTLACSVNSDFRDLDEMTYIGFDEEEMLNYYTTKPTDYPAYASDEAVRQEYDSLWSEVDEVIDSIKLVNNTEFASGDGSSEPPAYSITPIEITGTVGEEVVKRKDAYIKAYQERIARQPEVITYEVPGTDRKLAGIQLAVSSVDGMDTVTILDFIEELDGKYYEYCCSYVSQTYAQDRYEDETTYFEFLHAIDTMEIN